MKGGREGGREGGKKGRREVERRSIPGKIILSKKRN